MVVALLHLPRLVKYLFALLKVVFLWTMVPRKLSDLEEQA